MFQRKNQGQIILNQVNKANNKKACVFQKYAVIKLQSLLSKMACKNAVIELKKLNQTPKDCRSRQITQQTNYTTSPDYQLRFIVSVDIINNKDTDQKPSGNSQNETYLFIDDISKLETKKLNLKQQIKASAEQSKDEIQRLRDDCRILQQNQQYTQNIFLCQQ